MKAEETKMINNIGSDDLNQIMLDAMPICGKCWSKDFEMLACNEECVKLFGLTSKQQYMESFFDLSPKIQPDGSNSKEQARKNFTKAYNDGYYRFEWIHQTLQGELIPCEITLVRAVYKGDFIVAGYTRDLRGINATMQKMREADERTQIMLDATPLCANFWDKNMNNIDCNQEAVKLFELSSKQEYLERFFELSPQYQPDGILSSEKAQELVLTAFNDGYCRFEWMHQKPDGEPIPSEITLVRVKHKDDFIVVGYTRDLRELKATMQKIREADERMQIMFDATPLCANFWDKDMNNIDCNQEAVKLFELSSKQEYLNRFSELSPQYQPDGSLSSVKAQEMVVNAFKDGFCRFEWMHQKLNGEPIPSEITLVRVKYKEDFIVAGYTRDLRELKATMQKMREADERVQIMLDATPLCCNLWDKDLNNIDCNQEAVKLFELSGKQEYLERFFELSPQYQPGGILSSDLAAQNIATAFKDGYCRFEWMHQKLNGEPIPSEITLVRVKYKEDFIVAGYTRDLRELKETMQKMREADERVQIMLDATPLCCNLWDKDLNNIECNQEAVKLFELSSKQEYLERFFELSPVYQPCGTLSSVLSAEHIEVAFKYGYRRFEWMHQKLNGEQVPSEITLVRVKHRGEYIVAGYTRDLRELKAMLGEMHKAEADLRLARDAAEESTRAKSEFLANMSHEIRTPMNGILGLLHLALQTQLNDKQKDYMNKAEFSAKALLRIINDILDFSKIEAGKLEMENVPFSFSDILNEISIMFANKLTEKKLDFNISTPDSVPPVVGDPLRLKQVLVNIIGNSVKFTDSGHISLVVERLKDEGQKVFYKFSVSDTGIGMSNRQLADLFSPFTQADTSVTRKYGGTGLGLAICKNLVELMGGQIWAESELGVGTTFSFTAGFALAEDAEGSDPGIKADDSSRMSINAGARILLVEDVEINQLIAEEMLKIEGYSVDIANNGKEAVDKALSGGYDLILMDIQMPVMDGLAASKEIRRTDRDIPIIAMSAHAMSGDREKSIQSGMNDHITKPIDPQILYSTLNKWLNK